MGEQSNTSTSGCVRRRTRMGGRATVAASPLIWHPRRWCRRLVPLTCSLATLWRASSSASRTHTAYRRNYLHLIFAACFLSRRTHGARFQLGGSTVLNRRKFGAWASCSLPWLQAILWSRPLVPETKCTTVSHPLDYRPLSSRGSYHSRDLYVVF